MNQERIKVSSIVETQLPEFVRTEFPLISEFLKRYYDSIDGQGLPQDLLDNIDRYVKLDVLSSIPESTNLTSNVQLFDNEIFVSNTIGFPDRNGLIKIGDEIILYKERGNNSFKLCSRGFNGISKSSVTEELVFSSTNVSAHTNGTKVDNISGLSLRLFLEKLKKQISPGFENRELADGLNQNLFLSNSIDFYSAKGSDESFRILFRALYGKEVSVTKPYENTIEASGSKYRISQNLTIEILSGNFEDIKNRTIFQDEDVSNGINFAQGSVSDVQILSLGNESYYTLKLDYDYDKDITVTSGTVVGQFSIHPKTKLTESVSKNSTTINVESTLGFPESGSVIYRFPGSTVDYVIKYTSKNYNQFLGCSGITLDLSENESVRINSFSYAYIGNSQIKFRISSIASGVESIDSDYFYQVGDKIEIETLGKSNALDIRNSELFYNLPIKYDIDSVIIEGGLFKVKTVSENKFKLNEKVVFKFRNLLEKEYEVIDIQDKSTFFVTLDTSVKDIIAEESLSVKRKLQKLQATNFPNSSNNLTNIQNTYYDKDDSLYIVASSLPNYKVSSINPERKFSGQYNGPLIQIENHNFVTGDFVQYIPGQGNNKLDIRSGYYYVLRIDERTFQLASSRANLFEGNYISISSGDSSYVDSNGNTIVGEIFENIIILQKYSNDSLESSKIVKKIPHPEYTDEKYLTKDYDTVGIFNNGVEISNHVSKDSIFFGGIKEVEVSGGGSGYDVINPPSVTISDSVGAGATIDIEIQGNLERIDIIDPGFDFYSQPRVIISGGNGKEASAEVKLATVENILSFNSADTSKINLTNNTIGFSTFHRFRDYEEVVYEPGEDQQIITGLQTGSKYYVNTINDFSIKLFNNLKDVSANINEVNLSGYGKGIQKFKSLRNKNKIESIVVTNPGYEYGSKRVFINSEDIDIHNNSINVNDHGYNNGDIINYKRIDIYDAILGVLDNTNYLVNVIDKNNFRLCGISTVNGDDFNLRTNQYVDFIYVQPRSVHEFNYPPIKVEVTGITSTTRRPVLQPIFKGSVVRAFVNTEGIRYGSNSIFNYNRQPTFEIDTGSKGDLEPLVVDGRIEGVLIKNGGRNYTSIPEIIVNGSGKGAKLIPVIVGGRIDRIVIFTKGTDYDKNTTYITIIPAGSGAKLEAKIDEWKINEVQKLFTYKQITNDDGFIRDGKFGIQYTHLYAPRELRKTVLGKRFTSGKLTFDKDLTVDEFGIETESERHSPIIGWAYDGNPIYGPYGFTNPNGTGGIKCLESGFTSVDSFDESRPFGYPNGFFIRDFYFANSGDLDENNGRYCVTPEYPNGVYAYFTTIDPNNVETDSGSPFRRFKKPVYPYVIGESYKSKPVEFNFNPDINQVTYDPIEENLLRNTTDYNFTDEFSEYSYVNNPLTQDNQRAIIDYTSTGKVDSFEIVDSGDNYQVGDKISLSLEKDSEITETVKISRIAGKTVNNISYSTYNETGIEILQINASQYIGVCTTPHQFKNLDVVNLSGFTTEVSNNITKDLFTLTVDSSNYTLKTTLKNSLETGEITNIGLNGDLSFPSLMTDDILQINDEKLKVLEVDRISKYVRVEREIEGTVGLAHSISSIVYQNSKKIKFDLESDNINIRSRLNKVFYIDPETTVSIGLTHGPGIGNTLPIPNVSSGTTEVYVNTRSIYYRDHGLRTGDKLEYSSNTGAPIKISLDGSTSVDISEGQNLYTVWLSKDIIGLSTQRLLNNGSEYKSVDYGTDVSFNDALVYFSYVGTKNNHKFTTNLDNIVKIDATRNLINVSTAQTHGLSVNDSVSLNVKLGITTNYKIVYNDANRRMVVSPINFVGSDLSVAANTLTVPNHIFKTGDKLIYKSEGGSITDLGDSRIVYAVYSDQDNIKFAETYYESIQENPKIVSVVDQFDGYIGKVNPEIIVYKNSNVIFDLSDPSLSDDYFGQKISAFTLQLFEDSNYYNEFFTTEKTNKFNVVYSGKSGISSDAKLTLSIDDDVPSQLYYSLVKFNENLISTEKREYINDSDSIKNNNLLNLQPSRYNGTYDVVGVSTYSFNFFNNSQLESDYYSEENNSIQYTTTSTSAYGPIEDILLDSYNQRYKKEPIIKSIDSEYGYGAFLNPITKDIGKPGSILISDTTFEYPSDITLRPTCIFPQLLKVQPRYKIGTIEIFDKGVGYTSKHKLIVVDTFDNKSVEKISMVYDPVDENVEILGNEQSLINENPKVFPINNSNGVGITSATYNTETLKVTLQLDTAYSEPENFPFSIGDNILVENIVHDDGSGYNSSDYGYAFFKITDSDPNIGGFLPTISYSLSSYLDTFQTAGEFVRQLSFGRVIKEDDLPIFNVSLDYINFNIGEEVVLGENRGNVLGWNYENRTLKVASSTIFDSEGDLIGKSSGNVSKIISNTFTKSTFNLGSSSIRLNNWIDQKGFLNESTQRIHDNDYYQRFSYSLNSEISYDEWGESISSLVHPAGFKEFSELTIQTSPTEVSGNCELVSGICTSQDNGEFVGISELVSEINLDCYQDFDNVRELTQKISDNHVSNKIIFNSRILTDYFESIGNRVVEIQVPDIVSQVLGGEVRTVLLDQFNVDAKRYKKYLTYSQYSEEEGKKQISLLSAAFSGESSYIDEYGIITTDDKYSGHYNFEVDNGIVTLQFTPTEDSQFGSREFTNTVLSLDINNDVGINTLELGDVVEIFGAYSLVPSGSTGQTIISIPKSEFRSSKAIVAISSDTNNYIQVNELTFVADDYIGSQISDSISVSILDYGKIVSDHTSGFGTYFAYVDGDYVKVDFIADSSLPYDCDFNSSIVKVNNYDNVSTGSTNLNTGTVRSIYESIPIGSQTENAVASYNNQYEFGAYLFLTIENKSSNEHQCTELLVLTDTDNSEAVITEFGTIGVDDYRHGYFTATVSGSDTFINFVPLFGTEIIEVRGFMKSVGVSNPDNSDLITVNLGNSAITGSNSFFGGYSITLNRSFEMFNNLYPIFKRAFDGSDNNIVSIASSTIGIPGNNFVTGEKLRYSYGPGNIPIKIIDANIPGIGLTNILPEEVYAVRVNVGEISLCATAEDALKSLPQVLSFSSVGIGNSHYLQSDKQLEKCLVTIDNVIQSPISKTPVKTKLDANVNETTSFISLSGIGSIYTGDLVKINDEYMLIDDVGVGSITNLCRVRRDWMNIGIQTHLSETEVRKYSGNYNVNENFMTFVGDPLSLTPPETSNPDEIDFTGIQTSSSFYGRVFFRSGVVGSSNTTYRENYVFDDISSQFKNRSENLLIKSNEYNVHDVEDMNAVVLIKDIFQIPKRDGNPPIDGAYYIGGTGISTIFFVTDDTSQDYDINTFNIPVGGVIQQISSNNPTGYQPLSGAGGTAVYNLSNDLVSISIGSSGSGYRPSQQDQSIPVRLVGISSDDYESTLDVVVGFANVADGNVYSVTITDPINVSNEVYPPIVVIDEPKTYDNIPLIYSSSSPVNGIGTQATADIVVSQDGTIESFELKNYGYSYDNLEIITIPTDGDFGIPVDASKPFNELQIILDRVYIDKFSGWSMGEFAPLDYIDNMFNSQRFTFPLAINGEIYPIIARKGSRIDLKMTLLVFVNNILQRPDVGYKFEGGSYITFAEAPKKGDKCEIIFYKGTPGIDVVFNDIIETIEPGDHVTINSDDFYYQEEERLVNLIESIDTVVTNPYSGPGISSDFNLERPLEWCKQRYDIISGNDVFTKDRVSLEPQIYPTCNVINSVGIGSTHIFVDTLLPFFSSEKENAVSEKRKTVEIVSKFEGTRASVTVGLNSDGYINQTVITNSGFGYSFPPIITVATNVGTASSEIPLLIASIDNTTGSITSVSIAQTGTNFTTTPVVTVNEPDLKAETLTDVDYLGDYGNIVSVATTSITGAPIGLKLQLEIPNDSILRDKSIAGFAATASALERDYYFKVSNSNVGSGLNSLDSNGDLLFQSSSFIDNIYKVIDTEIGDNVIASTQVIAVNTEVASATMIDLSGDVTVNDGIEFTVGDYSNLSVTVSVNNYGTLISDINAPADPYYFGSYSWGRIVATERKLKNYSFGFPNTMTGLDDLPNIRRKSFLNFKLYNL
tara:strand:- start:26074 stop:38241 length:12168 start_codon:yes stop_codon:yes gene_type:complete